MSHSVIGIVTTRTDAENLVGALKTQGFVDNDISVLFPDKESNKKDFAHENSTKAPEGAVTGASTGGIIGGTLGLMAGIGALAIPGIGPLIAAGPIMAALSGAAVGATVGGVSGGLIGLGIPEYEAKLYEAKLLEGNILVAVHTEDEKLLKIAEDIYKQQKATDVHRTTDASVKK